MARGPCRVCNESPARTSAPAAAAAGADTRIPNVGYEPLSDEQREIRDLVRTLARERIAPRAAEIDATGEFPWDMVELLRDHEILGLPFEERFGGTGTGTLMVLVAIEEISKVCATTGLILALQELGALAIKNDGSEEQKERYLPRLASGEWLPAYALTEPGSGSDAAAMRSEARREGDEYVLNGSKRFITNAGVAGVYLVFAKTEPERGARAASLPSSSRPMRRASRSAGSSRRWASRAPRPARSSSPTAGFRLRTGSARRATASWSPCASSTARARGSPPRRLGSRRAPPTTRSSTQSRARRWGSRSRSTSSLPRSSPRWRPSVRRRAGSSTRSAWRSTRASSRSRSSVRWRSSSAATRRWRSRPKPSRS